MKIYNDTFVLLDYVQEVDYTTIEAYAEHIFHAVRLFIDKSQNKYPVSNKAKQLDVIFFCESPELMVELAKLVLKHSNIFKVYLDNPEEAYEMGSNALIKQFTEENSDRILTELNQETFDTAVIIKGNTFAGCNYDMYTKGATKCIVSCTLPIKDAKQLYLYGTGEVNPRAFDTFVKNASAYRVAFKTKDDYLLENEETDFTAHLRNTYVRDDLLKVAEAYK